MPIYEYQCRGCKSVYELLIRNDADERGGECPDCGSKRKEKQFSVFGMSGVEKSSGGESCGSCSGGNCGSCSC